MRRAIRRPFDFTLCLTLGVGCGETASTPRSVHADSATAAPEDTDATGPGSEFAVTEADPDEGPVPEQAPFWTAKVSPYGVDKASVSFAEAGSITVHVWQWAGFGDLEYTFDAAGMVIQNPQLDLEEGLVGVADAFAVDPEGRFHVLDSEGGCRLSVDRRDVGRLAESCDGGYGFAQDGSFVSRVSCSADSAFTHVEVFDVDNRELKHEKVLSLACGTSTPHFETAPLVVTDARRSRTIFSSPEHAEIFVFDWLKDTLVEFPIHRDARAVDSHGTGTILAMSLSEDGMHLATVGKSDGLAWLEPETYAVIARHPNVPYYTLFDACDCRTLDASVLAWSPEGRYLATTSAGGGVDIRDAEKRLRIVTLTGPVDPTKDSNWSGEEGPLLVRFSPDGQRLVALYPDHVAVYATELP